MFVLVFVSVRCARVCVSDVYSTNSIYLILTRFDFFLSEFGLFVATLDPPAVQHYVYSFRLNPFSWHVQIEFEKGLPTRARERFCISEREKYVAELLLLLLIRYLTTAAIRFVMDACVCVFAISRVSTFCHSLCPREKSRDMIKAQKNRQHTLTQSKSQSNQTEIITFFLGSHSEHMKCGPCVPIRCFGLIFISVFGIHSVRCHCVFGHGPVHGEIKFNRVFSLSHFAHTQNGKYIK